MLFWGLVGAVAILAVLVGWALGGQRTDRDRIRLLESKVSLLQGDVNRINGIGREGK